MQRGIIGPTLVTLSLLAIQDANAQLGDLLRGSQKIAEVKTQELAKMLRDRQAEIEQAKKSGEPPKDPEFVVVDVRGDAEIEVSIIPGAITKAQFEKDRAKYSDVTVIPYCTVGGRSGAYARKLVKDGATVKNYKGSILDWVNHGKPLVTLDGKATRRVHTHSPRYRVPDGYEAVY